MNEKDEYLDWIELFPERATVKKEDPKPIINVPKPPYGKKKPLLSKQAKENLFIGFCLIASAFVSAYSVEMFRALVMIWLVTIVFIIK